jgi:hypothetical protein
MPATWAATADVANACFPELSGSVEARVGTIYGRDLLRALILLTRVRFPDQANMKLVRELTSAVEAAPETILAEVQSLLCVEAGCAVERALNLRGSWFVEPLLFISMNVTEERVDGIARHWVRCEVHIAQPAT